MKSNTASLTTLLDLLAPAGLGFDAGSMQFGDQVGRVYVAVDYPPRVGSAWLSRLFGMPGVVGSLHAAPADPLALIKRVDGAVREFRTRLQQGSRNALVVQRTEQSLRDAEALLRKIDQEQQQVSVVVVVALVLAKDADELAQRARALEAAAAASGIRLRTATCLQRQGLVAAGPWAEMPPEVQGMGPRHLPAETIAASFPFVGGGVNHGSGILLGRDAEGGLVLLNRWNSPSDAGISNANLAILAASGAGKSFAAKLMLLREYQLGARVIVIDPEREYRDICRTLGGTWVSAAGGQCKINPLEVVEPPAEEGVAAGQVGGPLAEHVRWLRGFFAIYMRELSEIEHARLEEALLAVYSAAGICWGTAPDTVETWPTLGDLHAHVARQAEADPQGWERLEVLLRRAAQGADAALWNGQTSVPQGADFVVLDIHDLASSDKHLQRAQYANVLHYTWRLLSRDRMERKILCVDEAWILIDPRVPQALDFLKEQGKRLRKYSGSLWVITQQVGDFLHPDVARQGQAVFDNCATKLLLRQGEKDQQVIPQLLRTCSEAEMDLLATAKRGEGLLVAGNQRVRVKIEAAPHELSIIDPAQARARGLDGEG